MRLQGTTSQQWRLALDVRAQLGEGLHWDGTRQRLWMVDIHGRRLIRWALDAPDWEEWSMPQRVGWILPERGRSTVLVGLQEGVARTDVDRSPMEFEWVVRPFDGQPAMRLNDAKADASGAIWAGSLNNDNESRSDGSLFRLGTDGSWTLVDTGYTVANGPAISPDGCTLLHTDSGRRTIYAFDLDVAAGRASNRRIWRVFSETEGYPDGMTFDAQGCVWVAHWGACCVSRFDPQGALLRRTFVPAEQVTNVCFAGALLNRIFVTTAGGGRCDRANPSQPLSGALFELEDIAGIRGVPERALLNSASGRLIY